MVVLPIVTRELRVASRRKSTYRFRLAVAVGGLLVGGWIMLIPDLRAPQQLGLAMFTALSVVAFIEAFLAGIVTTSDCVSEEKREGTLGLLFLTDLKGYDIVFGKLAATSLNALYGLLAIFPIMAIPLLAGGVTGAEFGRVMMVALNTLFFSLAAGVLASAVCRDERGAGSTTFVILVTFAGIFPLLGGFATKWQESPLWVPFILPSPAYGAILAFDTNFQSATASKFNYFYPSLLCVHICAWGFLLLASVIVPRSWQDKAEGASKWGQFLRQCRYGIAEKRLAFRQWALDLNPFYWLASRDRFSVWLVWAFLGACGLMWVWGWYEFKRDVFETWAYFLTGLVLHTVMKLWIAGEASRRFGQDRRSGALELILSTPVSVREILRGQLLAIWRQFAGPIGVVLLADVVFLVAEGKNEDWVLLCIVGIISLIGDVIALAWVGMWMGLCSRHANRAAAAAVMRIMVLPWLVWGLVVTLVALMDIGGSGRRSFLEEQSLLLFWLFVSLAANFGFGGWARARLLNDFRHVATERYDGRARAVVRNVPATGNVQTAALQTQS